MIKNTLIGLGIFVSACSPAVAQEPIILDHYKTIIDQKPYHVEVCSDVSTSGDKSGDMLKGAIIGGILGNQNSTVGGKQMSCRTMTRYNESMQTIYSHSTITFVYEGKQYKLNFKK